MATNDLSRTRRHHYENVALDASGNATVSVGRSGITRIESVRLTSRVPMAGSAPHYSSAVNGNNASVVVHGVPSGSLDVEVIGY